MLHLHSLYSGDFGGGAAHFAVVRHGIAELRGEENKGTQQFPFAAGLGGESNGNVRGTEIGPDHSLRNGGLEYGTGAEGHCPGTECAQEQKR